MKPISRITGALLMAFLAWGCSKDEKKGSDCPGAISGVCTETASAVGIIVDTESKPVKDAKVDLILKDGAVVKKASAAAARDSVIGSLTTKADGRFLFENLGAGDYLVKAVQDTFGVAKEFSLAKNEDKDLGSLTIINNGIIIGKVDRSIVQQAENAYAVINEIGTQTNITRHGDYTFNNVPVYNNYTITIYAGEKGAEKPVSTPVDSKFIEVKAGQATQLDVEAMPTLIPKAELPSTHGNVVFKETAPPGLVADLAKLRRVIVFGASKVIDSVVLERSSAAEVRVDSLPVGKGLVVVCDWMDKNKMVHYSGRDTLDIVGDGKDEAQVRLVRKSGKVEISGSLLNPDKSTVHNLDTDTAYVLYHGPYADSTILAMPHGADGKYAFTLTGVPANFKLAFEIHATSEGGKRKFKGVDSVLVQVDTTVSFKVDAVADREAQTSAFSVPDTVIELGDTATVRLEWAGSKPDSVGLTLRSLGTTTVGVAGDRFYGILVGKVNLVATVQGIAKPDTFFVTVVEKEFSVADMTLEVSDTARAALAWKTKPPANYSVTYRSLTTNIVSVNASGMVTAVGAGEGKIEAKVSVVTKPDTFNIKVSVPFMDFELSLDDSILSTIQGGDVSTKVRIKRTKFTGPIVLSIPGLPDSVKVIFDPVTVAGDSAKMTFTTGLNPSPGEFRLNLIGKAQGFADRKDSVLLQVKRDNSIKWLKITAGQHHACALNDVGQAYCWGSNPYGELGNGNIENQTRPVRVLGTEKWSDIYAGSNYTCALTEDGTGYCWGRGDYGRLGDGSSTGSKSTPGPISVSGGDKWKSLSLAENSTCGVTTDGRGFCWGRNSNGQLGNGTTTSSTTRSQVLGGITWKVIAIGALTWGDANDGFVCGLSTEGEAYCWGNNSFGGLGDGNPGAGSNPLPVKVPGGRVFESLSSGTGLGNICGISTSGDAYCWGLNLDGQLGDGSTTTRSVPTLVLNDLKWKWISRGGIPLNSSSQVSSSTTCGITSGDKGYCWGTNVYGQVGNGFTGLNQTAPAAVSGGFSWIDLDAGYNHSCGISSFNQAYCWGNASLGAGSKAFSLTPWRVADPLVLP